MTNPLEADTFDPMQACRTSMAWTYLTRMRTLSFCSTLVVCVSLLTVLTPQAHGFAMMAHANPVHGTVAAPFDDGTGILAKTHHAKASHHREGDCGAGDPPENIGQNIGQSTAPSTGQNTGESTGPPRHACMAGCPAACPAACCSAIMIACRHPAGVVVLVEAGSLLPIPPSASRGGIHPPPRSDRMI